MSTLKVAAINNPSASSGGLAISASGNVTGAGLDLIVSQSFSGASSASINNCFSAAYDNYRVMFRTTSLSSADTNLGMRLRSSGSDDSGARYGTQRLASFGASSAADNNPNGNTVWNVGYAASANGDYQATSMDIFTPFLAQKTLITALRQDYTSTTMYLQMVSGFHNQSTSYDGLTLYPINGGTWSGTVSVYGYRK